jgi:response regulator RpfG family c-di-GMP phosphodiesterase
MSIILSSQEYPEIETTEYNLLLIDDLATLRRAIRRTLSRSFREIHEAGNYHCALEQIGKLKKGDIILSDLHLSHGNFGEGFELAKTTREIRTQTGNVFILHSSTTQTEDLRQIQELLKNGVIDAFLPKTHEQKLIMQTVKLAIHRKHHFEKKFQQQQT